MQAEYAPAYRWKIKTIQNPRLSPKERQETETLLLELGEIPRPRTRGECGTERPCPFVSCRHHLYLDINPHTGTIKLNFPGLPVEHMRESCALDIAEREAVTLEGVSELLNLTRERVRQIEATALESAREKLSPRQRRELRAAISGEKHRPDLAEETDRENIPQNERCTLTAEEIQFLRSRGYIAVQERLAGLQRGKIHHLIAGRGFISREQKRRLFALSLEAIAAETKSTNRRRNEYVGAI